MYAIPTGKLEFDVIEIAEVGDWAYHIAQSSRGWLLSVWEGSRHVFSLTYSTRAEAVATAQEHADQLGT